MRAAFKLYKGAEAIFNRSMDKGRHFKAVSPIIAVLLLIGITLAIGGLVASFVTTIVNNQQAQSLTAQQCSDAKVILQNGIYDAASDNLTIIVYNYGGVNLAFRPTVQYSNPSLHSQLVQTFPTFSIAAGAIQTVPLANVQSDIDHVTIQSVACNPPCLRCPGAQDILLSTNIRGL